MRIRTVKPELWQNEGLGQLPREVRMLAAALLNWADDDGYFRSHPALIAGALLPFDPDGQAFVAETLPKLATEGYLELRAGGIGFITNFTTHQRVSKPSPSRLKGKAGQVLDPTTFAEHSRRPPVVVAEASTTEVEVEVEQGSGSGTGKEEVEPREKRATVPPPPKVPPLPPVPTDRFASGDAFWAHVQNRRRELGHVTEKYPKNNLSKWWSEVLMELNGDPKPLDAALARFGANKHWSTSDPPWPFDAFIKNWRDYVRPARAA